MSLLAYRLWKRKQKPHRHLFDSENGVDRYGTVLVLTCSCGVGRVFGASSEHLHARSAAIAEVNK